MSRASSGRNGKKYSERVKNLSFWPTKPFGVARLITCWIFCLWLLVLAPGTAVSFNVRPQPGNSTVEVTGYKYTNSSEASLYTYNGANLLPESLAGRQLSYTTRLLPQWMYIGTIAAIVLVWGASGASFYLRRRWLKSDMAPPSRVDEGLKLKPNRCKWLRYIPVATSLFCALFIYLLWLVLANMSSKNEEILLGNRPWLALFPTFVALVWFALVWKADEEPQVIEMQRGFLGQSEEV